jgi:outer membrane protein TolC
MTDKTTLWVGMGCLGLLVLAGCSTGHYRRSADRETAGVLAEKTPLVPNMDPHFSIQTNAPLALESLPRSDAAPDYLGQEAESERGAWVLNLEKALEVGVKESRTYQNRKEQLYLAALALTGARHEFAPIFSGTGRGGYAVQTEQTVSFEPDPNNPDTTKAVVSDELVEQSRVSASGTVGVDWLIRDVGRISAAFSTDFVRFLAGDPRSVISSQLGGLFSRPLLRNAGFKAEQESLTQAERALLYELRDFVQFRKDFSVQVATAYYGVLGNRDATRNSFLNLKRSRANAEQRRALAQEGRATQTDLGRLEQQVLTAENTWIGDVRSYKRALDDYKIQLGLPVSARLILDDRDLAQLKIQHPVISVEDAIRVALAARLDLQNVRERHEDTQRKVKLAADGLKMQLDAVAGASISSPEEDSGFALPDPNRYRWNAGVNLSLPLDRKSERNVYRAALINEQRAAREVDLRQDEIRQQVRESWRVLEQARRSYEISEMGVKLAERRVEEQELLAQFGRAKAQEQVDTLNDLVRSRNEFTQALVAHTIARLQFWNNTGILYIKDKGQWEERQNARRP